MKDSPSRPGTDVGTADPRLTVRIIGRCSFRCPACSTFSSPERKGVLSPADFGRILRVLRENGFHGTFHISGGEPTLHPALPEMAAAASRSLPASRVVVFTNGGWVGSREWRARLKGLLAGPNVLVRFSLDRQHVEGRARARRAGVSADALARSESELFAKAGKFLAACLAEGATPGAHFDFAFKGTAGEAAAYLASLGNVPVYPIEFQKDPVRRPRRPGVIAVDLDGDGRPLVFQTLGHIPAGEALGGLETLPAALRADRAARNALSGARP